MITVIFQNKGFPFFNISKDPRESLETEGEGFQHFPTDHSNVKEWQNHFRSLFNENDILSYCLSNIWSSTIKFIAFL